MSKFEQYLKEIRYDIYSHDGKFEKSIDHDDESIKGKRLKVFHNGEKYYEIHKNEPIPKGKKVTPDFINSYIESIHREEDDETDISKRVNKHKYFILQDVDLNKIDSPYSHDIENEILPKKYNPIVLDSNLTIIDGTHRYEMAKNSKLKSIKAYVGVK